MNFKLPLPRFLKRIATELAESPVGLRLARGAAWSLAASLIARGLVFGTNVFAARMLGKAGFGELAAVQSTAAVFTAVAGLGLNLTATKHIAELRSSDPPRAGRVIALIEAAGIGGGLLGAALLVCLAPWLADSVLAAPRLRDDLAIAACLVFFTVLNTLQAGVLSGFESFERIALVNLVAGLSTAALTAAGVYSAGLPGALWGLAGGMAVACAGGRLAVRAAARRLNIAPAWRGCLSEHRILWTFSLPAMTMGIAYSLAHWACGVLLINQAGGYAHMGQYNAVLRLKQVPELLAGALLAPLLPMLSEQHGRGDTAAFKKTVSLAYRLAFLMIVPAALILAALPLLAFLPYGAAFEYDRGLVQWLALDSVHVALFWPVGFILLSTHRIRFAWFSNLLWAGLFFGFSLLLVRQSSAVGLAAALALAHVCASIPYVIYFYRNDRHILPPMKYVAVALALFSISVIGSRILGY